MGSKSESNGGGSVAALLAENVRRLGVGAGVGFGLALAVAPLDLCVAIGESRSCVSAWRVGLLLVGLHAPGLFLGLLSALQAAKSGRLLAEV